MRVPVLILAVSIWGLLSCGSKTTTESSGVESRPVQDSSDFVIIPMDSTKPWLFNEEYKSENLSTVELLILDSLLKTFIADVQGNLAEDKVGHDKINLSVGRYRRQYVPAISANGEKKVWVNCFCGNHFSSWQNQIVSVKDGGSCFFNLMINLTRKSYSFFIVNGEA